MQTPSGMFFDAKKYAFDVQILRHGMRTGEHAFHLFSQKKIIGVEQWLALRTVDKQRIRACRKLGVCGESRAARADDSRLL